MLDIGFVRDNADVVRDAMVKRGYDTAPLERLLEIDARRRQLITKTDQLRHKRKELSKKIGLLRREGGDTETLISQVQQVKTELENAEAELKSLQTEFNSLRLLLPNIPDPDAPVGEDESANVVVETCGEAKEADFEIRPHWEVGKKLGILDMERGAKIAASHFPFFLGDGARLVRALINFMLNLHTSRHGYKEVLPPLLVNRQTMLGTGQLPKFEDDMYRTARDELYLVPTAEVPLVNIHANQTLSFAHLPLRYTAYTPCFRREAGAYGAKTRGLLRVHQFDKVELVSFTTQEQSEEEHQHMLSCAKVVLDELGLVYRVVLLCTGELGFAARKCYDIEVWAPATRRWLEVSSISNCGDFQARRLGIRYREPGGRTRLCHTLNGSGVALARLIAAILEQFQNPDGSVTIPEVLRKDMGKEKLEPPL